jgi:hypothetical protein
MHDLVQVIRERAYHLWIESGRRDGNAESHWLAAQRQVLAESLSTIARVTDAEPSKARKAKAPRKKRAA